MGTDKLNSVLSLHPRRPVDPLFHIPLGQGLLTQGPALDPLKKSSGLVPYRFPRCQAGIQVNMGLDKGGQDQLTGAVQHLLAGPGSEAGGDFLKSAVRYPDVGGFRRVFNEYILNQHSLESRLS